MAVATASITLTQVWLMDPTQPTAPVLAYSTGAIGGGNRTNEIATDGDFRLYVGRTRMIVRSNQVETHQITLRNLSKATADIVESWAGRVLLLRDIYGRRVWGGYLDTQRLEYIGGKGVCDVQFTFTEITYSDEV